MANKELWLPRAAEGNWLCFFVHDLDGLTDSGVECAGQNFERGASIEGKTRPGRDDKLVVGDRLGGGIDLVE